MRLIVICAVAVCVCAQVIPGGHVGYAEETYDPSAYTNPPPVRVRIVDVPQPLPNGVSPCKEGEECDWSNHSTCVVGDWDSTWSSCSHTCGTGHKYRYRQVLRGTRTNIALRSLISPSAIRKDVIMIAYLATGTHGARALFLVVVTTLLPDTREDLFSEKNSIMALARLSLWMSSVASKHVLLIVSSACGLSGVRAQLHAVTLVPGYLKITEYIPVAMYPVVPVT